MHQNKDKQQEVKTDLFPIIKSIRTLIVSNKELLVPEYQEYYELVPKDFHYAITGPKFKFSSTESVQIPIWRNAGREFRKLIEGHSINDNISEKYIDLDFFYHYEFYLFTEGRLERTSSDSILKAYLRNIEKERQSYVFFGFLMNVAIHDKGIRFKQDVFEIFIRRATPKDVSAKIEATYNLGYIQSEYIWRDWISTVVEIRGKEGDYVAYNKLSQSLYSALVLYFGFSIRMFRRTGQSSKFGNDGFWGSVTSEINLHFPWGIRGYIQSNDNKLFVAFFKEVYVVNNFDENFSKPGTSIAIAFEQYKDALLNSGTVAKRIALVVIGLEALFLNEKVELKSKFSLRIGKLFSLLFLVDNDFKAIAELAYDLRSNYVHGGGALEKKQRAKIEALGGEKILLATLVQVLKTSIISFLVFGKEKAEILKLLDNSLLSVSHEIEIKEIIGPHRIMLSKYANVVVEERNGTDGIEKLVPVPRFA